MKNKEPNERRLIHQYIGIHPYYGNNSNISIYVEQYMTCPEKLLLKVIAVVSGMENALNFLFVLFASMKH
jgi:hypothetical protein